MWRDLFTRFFAAWLRLPTWIRLAHAALLTVLLAAGVREERGVVLGLAALGFYGLLFGSGALRPERALRRGVAHPLLDAALISPIVFFAAAYLTDLSLVVCAAIAGGALLLQLLLMRRRRARAAPA